MTLQQRKQNLLILRLGKKKKERTASERGNVDLERICFILHSPAGDVPSYVQRCGRDAQVIDFLPSMWQLYHGGLFSLIFQYLFCSLTPPELSLHSVK